MTRVSLSEVEQTDLGRRRGEVGKGEGKEDNMVEIRMRRVISKKTR